MRKLLVAAVLTICGSWLCLNGQPGSAGTDARLCVDRDAIASYASRLDRGWKMLTSRTFARPFDEKGAWREVQGDGEGIVATVYLSARKPLIVVFGNSSESGDWAQDVTYYFRRNGTLAKKHDLLNTFHGEASVTKTTLFGCSGNVLSSRVRHLDLATRKAKPPSPEFVDEPSPDYLRLDRLPFFGLLSR